MIGRVLGKFRQLAQLRAAARVLDTAPIEPAGDGLVFFSMLGHGGVLPYLVAVKSLHAAIGRGRVALLDDGTLTTRERALIAHHLGDPQILSIRDVSTGACPTGGCWERLTALLAMTRDDYVVQVDSDTVTLGPLPEVAAAIAANRSFTLLGDPGAETHGVLGLPAFMAAYHPHGSRIDPHGDAHVQGAIEGNWHLYPDGGRWRYVRGCAGFAGFARGAFAPYSAECFSRAAERIVGGAKWRRWGSEQVASNFLIANAPDPVLLPYAGYANYWREPVPDDVRFLHFVGTHRHATDEYRRATIRAIERLR